MGNKISIKNKPLSPAKKRIMIFGTFDMVHPGHRHMMRQARALAKNPELVVSLARDINVLKIKGRLPKNNEQARLTALRLEPLVDKAVLGAIKAYLTHIVKYQPDIIALGYDQQSYVKGLKKQLIDLGLKPQIVRLKSYKPKIYKTSLLI